MTTRNRTGLRNGSTVNLISVILLLICLRSEYSFSQSLYLPQGTKYQPFIERLEILLQKSDELNIASAKSVTRHVAVDVAGLEDSSSGKPSIKLSRVDQYNLQSLLTNNAEWVTREGDVKGIYKNKANLLEFNKGKTFLALNPILQINGGREDNNPNSIYYNAAGLSARGMFAERFGFYASVTKIVESPPFFVRERIQEYNSLPGAGEYEEFGKTGFQFWDVRGGITFKALKYFDFQLAYDRNFIGNGYRSLFLSDFATNYVFLKANTRIWKFKYQHMYAPLVPQFETVRDTWHPVGGKMTSFHHLSFNATNWLNIALFQSVSIINRRDWLYMIPIIFYPVSDIRRRQPANNIGGFEFKANIAKRGQLYGQLLIDHLKIKDIRNGSGSWNNRFGVQLGGKYINLFNINNLDLQIETNIVRPYTYSADSLGSYTHYNQPLAHPFGANFVETIGILRYQPHKRIMATLRAIYWHQGIDTADQNFGGNIRKGVETRPAEFGYTIPTGVGVTGINAHMLISYEIFENLFIDASLLIRRYNYENDVLSPRNTILMTGGIRMNMFSRHYDY